MNPLISLILLGLAIYFAFKIHTLFGIAFIIIAAVYVYFSNRANVLANKSETAYQAGDTESAIFFFREAAAASKNTPAMVSGLAYMLTRCGNPEEGLEQINSVLSSLSIKPEIRNQAKQIRALINYKLKNFDEAYEEGLDLYESGNTTSSMRGLLGLLMISAGEEAEKALRFCEDAYDYDSDNRDIADNYLLSLTAAKKYDKAKEISDALIKLAPEFPESYYHSALLYKELGDTKKAAELLEKLRDCKIKYMSTFTKEDVDQLKATL